MGNLGKLLVQRRLDIGARSILAVVPLRPTRRSMGSSGMRLVQHRLAICRRQHRWFPMGCAVARHAIGSISTIQLLVFRCAIMYYRKLDSPGTMPDSHQLANDRPHLERLLRQRRQWRTRRSIWTRDKWRISFDYPLRSHNSMYHRLLTTLETIFDSDRIYLFCFELSKQKTIYLKLDWLVLETLLYRLNGEPHTDLVSLIAGAFIMRCHACNRLHKIPEQLHMHFSCRRRRYAQNNSTKY